MTGHYGGALTHGPDYLSEFAPGPLRARSAVAGAASRPKVTDVARADIYLDVVAPLLTAKCSSCHNEDKRRGGLSSRLSVAAQGWRVRRSDQAWRPFRQRAVSPDHAAEHRGRLHAQEPQEPAERCGDRSAALVDRDRSARERDRRRAPAAANRGERSATNFLNRDWRGEL